MSKQLIQINYIKHLMFYSWLKTTACLLEWSPPCNLVPIPPRQKFKRSGARAQNRYSTRLPWKLVPFFLSACPKYAINTPFWRHIDWLIMIEYLFCGQGSTILIKFPIVGKTTDSYTYTLPFPNTFFWTYLLFWNFNVQRFNWRLF